MIKLLLVDDHHLVRHGLSVMLSADPDMEVIAQAKDAFEALSLLASGLKPDVLLTDIVMPGQDGCELAGHIAAAYPEISILMLTVKEDEQYLKQAFEAGSYGYVLKTATPDELLFAIRQAAQRKTYLSYKLTEKLIRRADPKIESPEQRKANEFVLNEREMEVLQLISDGQTNQETADRLFTSKRTVEGYRQALFAKTGTNNAAQLVRFAMRAGLIT